MTSKHWIFLSPHFDDVVLSCGGLVYTLAKDGHHVEIWALMGGFPATENYSDFANQNHHAWDMTGEAAILMRRCEDQAACDQLGAQPRHFNWLDAIYRYDPDTNEPIVNNNHELFSHPPEINLVGEIADMLIREIPANAHVVGPISLGSHIDHQAVSQAVEKIPHSKSYYADYPYILTDFNNPALQENQFTKLPHKLTEKALKAWQDAVLCYVSQLSGFWRDEDETRLALRNYYAGGGGGLWEQTRDELTFRV